MFLNTAPNQHVSPNILLVYFLKKFYPCILNHKANISKILNLGTFSLSSDFWYGW